MIKNFRFVASSVFALSFIAALLPPNVASAQVKVFLRPFIMVGEMEGDLTTRGVESDFQLGWGNAFQKGNGALGVDLEIRSDDFSSMTSGWYTMLSDTTPDVAGLDQNGGKQDLTTTFVTQVFGLNLIDEGITYLDLNAGGRVAIVENSLTARRGGLEEVIEQSDTWVDPVVGLNSRFELDDGLTLRALGDVGGFGVSSDLTWQAALSVGIRIAPRGAISLGYRAIGYTYEKDDFKYDLVMRGPTAGFEFSF